MVGYATSATTEAIPYELAESRKILHDLWDRYPATRDAKAQVTTLNGEVHSIVVSAERLADADIASYLRDRHGPDVTLMINQAGPWDNG
jgi:S-adenosylmethionine synthetase